MRRRPHADILRRDILPGSKWRRRDPEIDAVSVLGMPLSRFVLRWISRSAVVQRPSLLSGSMTAACSPVLLGMGFFLFFFFFAFFPPLSFKPLFQFFPFFIFLFFSPRKGVGTRDAFAAGGWCCVIHDVIVLIKRLSAGQRCPALRNVM